MKKVMYLVLCLVLVFSFNAFAQNEGNPFGGLNANIDATVGIGPYASVIPQKVKLEEDGWWYRWGEDEPGMDFGYYTGQAGYGKIADSNCFIIETNTELKITFSGESLENEHGDKMLTRYWAWQSLGVTDLGETFLFFNIPDQILPSKELGYFGEAGKAPRLDKGRDVERLIFQFLEGLNREYWPEDEWFANEELEYDGIKTNGFYAFQVFGFASTDDISSQRAGEYTGKIILTVSK